ncbi:DUF2922 domain-containing protein [Haloimpatiens sp. FM7315]|uniref:DUF2922 domain-containing protein n=1 Tax=Haloimpatiens sp. FM7315 TaxID=3298609 RepID=UPI00370AEB4D
MNKDLVMQFMDESKKKVSLRLKDVKNDVSEKEISDLMDLIIQKNIFIFGSGDLKSKVKAEIVSTNVEEFEF